MIPNDHNTMITSRLLRSFSVLSRRSKSLPKDELARAFELLKGTNTANVTNEEKNKYIQYFTQVLNTDIREHDHEKVQSHFVQSLTGLNTILNVGNKTSQLDPISIKDTLTKCGNEKQVLQVFDELLMKDMLTVKTLKFILMNKHTQDMQYFYDSLKFIKRDDLKLLVCSKAVMLRQYAFAQRIYDDNVAVWLAMREEGELTAFLQKSLYQLIWKINRDLKLIQKLEYSRESYIQLIESIPRQLDNLPRCECNLTASQELFIQFVRFINDQQITATSNKFLQKLLKLNVDARISMEEGDEMTIHKYRYIGGLVELCEDLNKQYGGVDELVLSLNELDDVLINETVLKFI